jgi:pilus assembly protein Flp/PilA
MFLMLKAVSAVRRFLGRKEGATMVEYALLVALIALVAAAGVQILGTGLSTMFDGIGDEVNTATVPDIP